MIRTTLAPKLGARYQRCIVHVRFLLPTLLIMFWPRGGPRSDSPRCTGPRTWPVGRVRRGCLVNCRGAAPMYMARGVSRGHGSSAVHARVVCRDEQTYFFRRLWEASPSTRHPQSPVWHTPSRLLGVWYHRYSRSVVRNALKRANAAWSSSSPRNVLRVAPRNVWANILGAYLKTNHGS